MIRGVHFEKTPDRLKAVLPAKRNWWWFALFSILVLIWLVGLVWGIIFTVRDIAFSGERFALVFTIMLLVWLYIWYRLGKILWKQWQFYAADREILFVEKERLIVRRPVSILGITDAYDMNHVSPFFYSEEQHAPAFSYGHQRVYFGHGLDQASARQFVRAVNRVAFPDHVEDEALGSLS
jgi:hypothetical protein